MSSPFALGGCGSLHNPERLGSWVCRLLPPRLLVCDMVLCSVERDAEDKWVTSVLAPGLQ